MKQKFFVLLLLMAGSICAWADPTAQLLWCSDNSSTMYFVCTETIYEPGDTWDGQTITTVWSGDDVVDVGYNLPKWRPVAERVKMVVFDRTFQDVKPKTLSAWFNMCVSLTTIKGLEFLDTSEVTSTNAMFNCAENLTELDLTGFDMSKVEDAKYMFWGCMKLTTIYCNDTWNIPDTKQMFMWCNVLTSPAIPTPIDWSQIDWQHKGYDNPNTGLFTSCKITPQVFYCSGDKTLYLTNTRTRYQQGDTYNGQTINDIWYDAYVTDAINARGDYMKVPLWNDLRDGVERACIELPFRNARPITTQAWFFEFNKLTEIEHLENLNTSEVKSFGHMFAPSKCSTSITST